MAPTLADRDRLLVDKAAYLPWIGQPQVGDVVLRRTFPRERELFRAVGGPFAGYPLPGPPHKWQQIASKSPASGGRIVAPPESGGASNGDEGLRAFAAVALLRCVSRFERGEMTLGMLASLTLLTNEPQGRSGQSEIERGMKKVGVLCEDHGSCSSLD